jgi:hypothetical protein
VSPKGWHQVRTSAKTGEGVEPAFAWLARAMVDAERSTDK